MAFELPAKSPAIGTPKLSRSYETANAALAECACVGSECREPGDRAEAMASDALQVAAGLSAEVHHRLAAEAAAGDPLAELVTAMLGTPFEGAVVLRRPCAGIGWHPEPDGPAERCASCGAWSPVSLGVENIPF
jgi:hypothetical protein